MTLQYDATSSFHWNSLSTTMTTPVSAHQLFPVLESLGFDIAAGVEYCGSDEAFYCDLVRELHSDVLVQRLSALGSGDLQRRREFAHQLKSTLQVLGETRAAARARELELALRSGEPGDDLTGLLLQELDQLDAALRKVFC